jgi:hypothetical protein
MIRSGPLFVLILLMSCGADNDLVEAPDPLISSERMADIIVDINLVEAQLTEVQFLQSIIKDSVQSYYSGLFTKHNITQEQLNENLAYYVAEGLVMDSIYEDALAILTDMEKDLEHVKMPINDLTHISSDKMKELLMDSAVLGLISNADIVFPVKHDSILRYYRINQHLLDSMDIGFRRFGVSLNFYVGNEKRMSKFMQTL